MLERVEKFIYTHDILGRGPPSWTVMELCIPPLEEKTERPSKGPDQPKTKEEAVDRRKGQRSTTAYAEWATKATAPSEESMAAKALIQFNCYMVSADYEPSRVVLPKGERRVVLRRRQKNQMMQGSPGAFLGTSRRNKGVMSNSGSHQRGRR